MNIIMDVLLILLIAILAVALREAVLHYRWIIYLRRARAGTIAHDALRRSL